jgi:hypothetical protein
MVLSSTEEPLMKAVIDHNFYGRYAVMPLTVRDGSRCGGFRGGQLT